MAETVASTAYLHCANLSLGMSAVAVGLRVVLEVEDSAVVVDFARLL